MHRYAAYGLRIDSEFPLPGLVAVHNGAPDVTIRAGDVPPAPEPAEAPLFVGSAEAGCLYWDRFGGADIRRGRDVVVRRGADADDRALALFLIGPVLGYLLTQRGFTALHASAVALDGRAAAFLGGPGWGKSTLAAALHARGHPVVADDIVAVRVEGGAAAVTPGFPQLKLWPEAARELGDDPARLERLVAAAEKRARPTPEGFPGGELPLAGLYVLDEGESLEVEELRPADAVIELVRHAWGARSLHATGPAARLSRFAEVANAVPVYRLSRPEPPPALSALGELVERALAERA